MPRRQQPHRRPTCQYLPGNLCVLVPYDYFFNLKHIVLQQPERRSNYQYRQHQLPPTQTGFFSFLTFEAEKVTHQRRRTYDGKTVQIVRTGADGHHCQYNAHHNAQHSIEDEFPNTFLHDFRRLHA